MSENENAKHNSRHHRIIAGNDKRDDANFGAFQPFDMLQLGGGTCLRWVGNWLYDFEHDTHFVPIRLGIGRVFKTDKAIYNLFIEPQYSTADEGDGIAKWQVFTGFNMQFLGKK